MTGLHLHHDQRFDGHAYVLRAGRQFGAHGEYHLEATFGVKRFVLSPFDSAASVSLTSSLNWPGAVATNPGLFPIHVLRSGFPPCPVERHWRATRFLPPKDAVARFNFRLPEHSKRQLVDALESHSKRPSACLPKRQQTITLEGQKIGNLAQRTLQHD